MLEATPKEITERKALVVNPAKTCQPVGAMYASLGIHGCLPHSHGSQGCCSYHRSHLTRHYREPVMASTSSFTEGAAVFGGQPNLRQALKTIYQVYDPLVVAVHTTCLSETIGDDLNSILAKAKEEKIVPEGRYAFHTNTPSYVGSHVTGFANLTRSALDHFAVGGERGEHLVLLPGYVEPSDMRHLKRLMKSLGVPAVVFPDTSDVLDTPQTGHYHMFPKGGTTVEELTKTGTARACLALGRWASEPAAALLGSKFGIPYQVLDLPLGIQATDRFMEAIMEFTGVQPPAEIVDDRGRLVDMLTDMQRYLYGKTVALWGDPDHLIPLTEFLVAAGMRPLHVLTGTPGKKFELKIKGILKGVVPGANIKAAGDLLQMHQWIKNEPVDLMIGNSYGKYLSRAEDIPLVRLGWPILDRIGHSYFPVLGYRGGMHFLSNLLNTLLDRLDRDAPDESLELVL
ncbi:MAG: nitrogenase molybdenum-iron protein subunit beta [Deltaproteobacteria bacterium]|nr:nitrogenase molybdenum-iron protein subunit beta [Deltaproteobacteria bacterium]